jgi:hypothetical protein
MLRVTLLLLFSNFIFASSPIEKEGFSGNFDLGLNYTQNIEKTLQFNNVFSTNYKVKKSVFSLSNNISFISKTGQEEVLNKGVQDFKYSLNTNDLSADFTLQHLYDISRSIQKRWTTGIGLSYAVINSDIETVRFGISTLREKETPLEGDDKMNTRLSGNIDFKIKLLENLDLISKNYYQPNIENAGDFRWKTNFSIRFVLNSHFLFSINNTFNYDSFPETDIPEIDYQLINSISYTF